MKISERFYSGQFQRPKTILHQGLDGRLLIAATPWGATDAARSFCESVESFLSAALADADVTSPFAMLDCVDKMTNQLRIALLLSNERIHRSVNSVEYMSGVETLILFKGERQISWARVGGMGLVLKNSDHKLNGLCMSTSLEQEFVGNEKLCSLPVDTIGLNSSSNVQFGSVLLQNAKEAFLFSGVDLLRPLFCDKNIDLQQVTQKIIKHNPVDSFWLARVVLGD